MICLLLFLASALFQPAAAAPSRSLAAPKLCRVNDLIFRRKAPPNTPPFLHTTSSYLSCHALLLDRHERPTTAEIVTILNVLPNTHIEALHLIGIPLSIDVVVNLAAYIANSKLKTLHLFDLDELDDPAISILADAMSKNGHLTTIILANMFRSLGDVAGQALTSLMRTTKAHHVDVRGFKGGRLLIQALQSGLRNPHLKSLCVRQIGLNTTGLRALASAIQFSSIEHLDLSGNKFGDDGVRIVARRMLKSQTLVELDVSDNAISDLGAGDLAVALEENTALHHLIALNNPAISDDGVFEFNEILSDTHFGNKVIASIEFTSPLDQTRGPSTKTLKQLEELLVRNRNAAERESAVPERKMWMHEGSVSGNRKLSGVDGKNEFIARERHDAKYRNDRRGAERAGRTEL